MVTEKLLLTEDIAWKDLMALKASRIKPGTTFLLIILGFLAAVSFLVGIFMFVNRVAAWPLFMAEAVAFIIVITLLNRKHKAAISKVKSEKLDIEAMLFDTDVCIRKHKKDDGDVGYNYYLTFAKAGLIEGADVARISGFPTYDNTSVGDRFITVRLRDNPQIVKYYSCHVWWLGDPQET